MDTIFINSDSKTYNPYRLLLYLAGKINFKKVISMLLYQTLLFTVHGKT